MVITPVRGEELRNQMIDQESFAELRRRRIEIPGAGALADGIPGPHGFRVDSLHQLGGDTDAALTARQPYPVVLCQAQRPPGRPVDEQSVVAEDLPQPSILRVPGMVHLHWPLRHRVQRKAPTFAPRFLERRVPKRQRVEIGRDPLAMCLGRHHLPVPAAGEAEALKRLDIELQYDRLGSIDESHRNRGFEISLVGVLEIPLVFGQLMLPKATICDVALELTRIGRPMAGLLTLGATPAAERSDARPTLVIDDVVGIASRVTRRPFRRGKARQPESCTDLDQYILKRPDI